MKKKQKIIGRILGGFELPQDLDPHRFCLQWIGGEQLLVEQHRGILCFEIGRIRLSTEQGTLQIEGDALTMERLSESRALVSGDIACVSLERKS
jgi:sporulation protein YqfC